MADIYDVAVVGGGPGGYAFALRAAGLGLKVAIAERDKVGGTCLHRGCIPTKGLLHAAEIFDNIREAKHYGINVSEPSVDFAEVQRRKQEPIKKLYAGLSSLIKARKIDVFEGDATTPAPKTVAVADKKITADNIVIAVGSYARSLPGIELDGTRVITSDHALVSETLPAKILIVGAGAVGVEFASVYRSFGSEVCVVEALDRAVPLEDADISKEFAAAFKRRGIQLYTSAMLQEVKVKDRSVEATFKVGDKSQTLDVDQVLIAAGRGSNAGGMDLSPLGVNVDREHVVVDANFKAGEGVWAIGDCVAGVPKLAHAAFAMGFHVAEQLAGNKPVPLDLKMHVPAATYSVPEVASVGLTEQAAKDAGYNVKVVKHSMAGIAKAQILNDARGFCKIVYEEGGAILGVHLIGPRVTENIAEAILAVGWEAFPAELAAFVHPHPTISESIGEAALAAIGRPLHG